MVRKNVHKIIIYGFLILLSVICIIPFLVMILNATQDTATLAGSITLRPGTHVLENYQNIQKLIPFWKYVGNSLISSVGAVAISAYFGTMAAYGFEKFQFKGKNTIFNICMLMMVIPTQISLIGMYKVFDGMKILNTLWTLILPGIANVLTVYWMRGNIYQVIDNALLEAAVIDGCSELQIFHKIVLPICKPGLVTICIMNFVTAWNDYINPVTFLTGNKNSTITVGIAMMKSFDSQDLGAIYMATALSTIIILIFYLIFSSQIVGGVTEGSVKG